MTDTPDTAQGGKRRRPWIELILIIGLPLAVLAAGAYTIAVAVQQGFTPIAGTAVAPKGS